MLAGPYKFPNVFCEVVGVYTNTTFVDAYRGAGRPEATYVVERAMDLLADELGMDAAAIRRRNFLPPDAFPYENPSGLYTAAGGAKIYIDSGNYEPALDRALAMAGYDDLDAAKAEARGRGRYLGVGLSTYIEVCGVAPSKWIGAVGDGWGAAMWESCNIRVHLTGKVVVTAGTQPQGQGHETTYAQVVSHELGMPMDDIVVQHSDTQGTPFGYGSYGSRTGAVGLIAAVKAAGKVKDKARKIAAFMLEAAPEDIVYEEGKLYVRGSPDKVKTIQEIAFATALGFDLPADTEPYLDETAYYDTPNCTFPFGTHIAIVEVDEETGNVELKRYIAVDDVGKKINPMIVDGQLHGGIAQGVGQALWEHAVYDDNGQLLSGSMSDYALPRASWFPMFELDETVTPSPVNPLGVKGVGEAGAIASTAAVVNAVVDALSPAGHPPHRHAAHTADRLARHQRRPDERRHHGFGGAPVIPAAFEYSRASSVDEALGLLSQHAGSAKIIAGGHSLLPLLKLRVASVERLIDIGKVSELRGIRAGAGGGLTFGALTTYRDVLDSAEVRSQFPILIELVDGDRGRAGPEPRHRRGRDRACRPSVGPAGGAPGARRRGRRSLAGGRAGHPRRPVLRGRIRHGDR